MISFDAFLEALGLPEPYSWQRRFALRCAAGEPPSVIAVPTGAGKTRAVDALVWALASQADRPAGQRTVGVRIVWAIDRRILVDEVHAHARWLAQQLAEAESGPLREVADRLCGLADADGLPLVATRWRGGIVTERELHGPFQPQVITSTVAQIASRLLFRGYGVSDASRGLAAGLAACDTTICLDEAHLAEPFRQTVEEIRRRREETAARFGLPGVRAITITATPQHGPPPDETIVLDDEDRAREDLQRRLTAVKRARLLEPAGTTDRERVAALIAATLGHVGDGAGTVACVVNTVRRAREVHRQLKTALARLDEPPQLGLLIGAQRPADRAEFLRAHGPKLFGRGGTGDDARLVVVATQTFEVGIDADVEAMVTESASATALIQRLGRLNRHGKHVGRATIVRDEGSWLYGDDERAAWDWLQARAHGGEVDVSVDALARPPAPPHAAPPQAPALTDAVVDALSCPERSLGRWARVAVEAFWRPGEERRADVAVCWRADLRAELAGPAAHAYREMLLELVPPRADELLTLTINGARALLAASADDAASTAAAAAARLALADGDVEGATAAARFPEPEPKAPDRVPFLVVRGDELLAGSLATAGDDEERVRPRDLRPGDVIVLPARSGAASKGEAFPATDVAADVLPLPIPEDEAGPDPVPVRMTPEALRVGAGGRELSLPRWRWLSGHCRTTHARVARADSADGRQAAIGLLVDELRRSLPEHRALERLAVALADPDWRVELHEIAPDATGLPRFEPGDDEASDVDVELPEPEPGEDARELGRSTAWGRPLEAAWVLVPIKALAREGRREGAPPTLDAHGRAVLAELERSLARLELPDEACAALRLAAAAHDHGKADPRMQAYFRRGVDAFGAEPIAKSTFGTDAPATDRLARHLAGLPRRWRHEIPSVAVIREALAAGSIALDGISVAALDTPLAFDAAGDSHGVGFPLPPVPGEGAPARSFHVDAAGVSGTACGDGDDGWDDGAWLERALDVRERYGAWGAAYLEGLVRSADRVVSRDGG